MSKGNIFFTQLDEESTLEKEKRLEVESQMSALTDQLQSLRTQVKQMLDVFNQFDVDNQGYIPLEHFLQCIQQLHPQDNFHSNVLSVVNDLDVNLEMKKTQFEYTDQQQSQRKLIGINLRTIEFLKLLNEYKQHQTYVTKDYIDAEKIQLKIKEIQRIETIRWKINISHVQEKELELLEKEQKEQFQDLIKKWDECILRFDCKAYSGIEKLKSGQQANWEDLQQQLDKQRPLKPKPSKGLAGLRHKEHQLVQLQWFQQAAQVKQQADQVEHNLLQEAQFKQQQAEERKQDQFQEKQHQHFQLHLHKVKKQREGLLQKRQNDTDLMIQSNSIYKEEVLKKQKREGKQMQDMISYVITYFDKPLDNTATIQNFIRGRKLISLQKENVVKEGQSQFKSTIPHFGVGEQQEHLYLSSDINRRGELIKNLQKMVGTGYKQQEARRRSTSIDKNTRTRIYSHRRVY